MGISAFVCACLPSGVLSELSRGPETDLLLTGRTTTMAPDVDGQVLINEGSATVGEIVPVRITEAHPYDLVGGIERQ